ncbi:chemotaxis protein MotA [Anaeromicropila herbilytica]|uniref:Chemotaxis protein MotA n=2 Tax=Anaeromicropila herbilytica TaxID=2785025 RepID=A0A7R7IDA0_9FIRM|nr:chemotaxis protein MotA [Anaeromicropila herbilytica]
MNLSFIASLIVGLGALILAFIVEGGTPSGLLQPTAALIVFGGTLGALGCSFPISNIKRLPKILGVLMSNQKQDKAAVLETFIELSNKIRKEGLLSLEVVLNAGDYDPFMVSGLQLVIDGIDGENIKKTMEIKLENIMERHEKGYSMFEAMGGYLPTMGVVGTVMGLINVMGSLSEAADLGPKIGVAFIATLYGVGSANLIFLPIANSLKSIDAEEVALKSMIIDGVLMIQEGANPTLIRERLKGYLEDEKESQEIRE